MRKFTAALTALLLGSALAHSELEGAVPAENATVSAPSQVKLSFSEPLQVRFSTFKVYPLSATGSNLKVNGAAGALKTKVFALKNDAAQRADRSVTPGGGNTSTVTLTLKSNLKPGAYVVMWKALSEDTHTSGGYYVFYVK